MTQLPHGALDPRTREEIAQVEIGHTDISRAVAAVLFAGFLLIAAVVPVIELARVVAGDTPARKPWSRLEEIVPQASAARAAAAVSGDGTVRAAWRRLLAVNRTVLEGLHEFEKSLEDESLLAGVLRPGAQRILTGRLGAGNEQVYVRPDGWLFYRPDVESITGAGFLDPRVMRRRIGAAEEWTTPPQPDPRPAILSLHRDLGARGIALVVMPVPVKPTIHPDLLSRRVLPRGVSPQNPDYERLLADLRRAGVQVFDPTPVLAEARDSSGATQYLMTDTHWRPEAMEIVAERLAAVTRSVRFLPEIVDPGYRTASERITARGDVFGMLDLPERQSLFPAESVALRQILQADGSPWRASPSADVLVLGDSFANIYSLESMGWGTSAGLVEQLSFILRRPVDRLVQNDAGAYATREMLARAPERLGGKRVVVYQFAAREFAFGDWKVISK